MNTERVPNSPKAKEDSIQEKLKSLKTYCKDEIYKLLASQTAEGGLTSVQISNTLIYILNSQQENDNQEQGETSDTDLSIDEIRDFYNNLANITKVLDENSKRRRNGSQPLFKFKKNNGIKYYYIEL